MAILRIVPDLATDNPAKVAAFYRDLFGIEPVMDFGWIVTSATSTDQKTQISFASEGGSGTEVPALSIEVDNLDEVLARARDLQADITYGPADEPWGVRRFFLRDPDGRILNILTHQP